jgi:hypothetical protein
MRWTSRIAISLVLLTVTGVARAGTEDEVKALRNDPNRFRSILGRARAAKQLGDIAASRDAYQKLVALSTSAVSERPELSEALAFFVRLALDDDNDLVAGREFFENFFELLCSHKSACLPASARPNGVEMVSRCASTVQSLAFRQASQVFGIGGGLAPIRREKSPRGATSPPSR